MQNSFNALVEYEKNALAFELGRKGGLVGGKARAAKLTPEQRSEIAKKAPAAQRARPSNQIVIKRLHMSTMCRTLHGTVSRALERIVRDEAHAQEYFEPFEDRLYGAVAAGLAVYREQPHAGLISRLSRRSHSSNRNDLIWEALQREFPEFTFVRDGNSRFMLVGDEYRVRVKKLNANNRRPQNYLTQSAIDFLCQRGPLTLFDTDPPTNVDLGYTLAGMSESVLAVYLRCPQGLDHTAWMLALREPAEVAVTQEAAPIPEFIERPLVRPKMPQTEETKEEPGAASAV